MTSTEILNLDSVLSSNESFSKFKTLHLFEEIKNNYILLLRKDKNQSNYINGEKFIYFIREDRGYITSELNEIVTTYYSLFLIFITSNPYYVEELEKINSTDIKEIRNFLSKILSIFISNCLDYTEGKNYGNKCYTSVDVRSYHTDYNFQGFYVGREYVSGGIKDFLNRLYELSEKFSEAFIFTSSAKKFCKKILLKNMNSEEWKNYDPKIKEFLSLTKKIPNKPEDYILTNKQFEKLNSLIDKYLQENI